MSSRQRQRVFAALIVLLADKKRKSLPGDGDTTKKSKSAALEARDDGAQVDNATDGNMDTASSQQTKPNNNTNSNDAIDIKDKIKSKHGDGDTNKKSKTAALEARDDGGQVDNATDGNMDTASSHQTNPNNNTNSIDAIDIEEMLPTNKIVVKSGGGVRRRQPDDDDDFEWYEDGDYFCDDQRFAEHFEETAALQKRNQSKGATAKIPSASNAPATPASETTNQLQNYVSGGLRYTMTPGKYFGTQRLYTLDEKQIYTRDSHHQQTSVDIYYCTYYPRRRCRVKLALSLASGVLRRCGSDWRHDHPTREIDYLRNKIGDTLKRDLMACGGEVCNRRLVSNRLQMEEATVSEADIKHLEYTVENFRKSVKKFEDGKHTAGTQFVFLSEVDGRQYRMFDDR